ncbi:MAG: STAS domain-containing protein [Bacteroidales bacterium]|nr:STAS domain-containing protein [Bacteroidales bacterium]
MNIITDEKIRCVKPIGKLDANSSNDLDLALIALPENGQDIILDLSDCPYMSSAGIRILLKTNKKLQAGRNIFYIAGVVPDVFHVLEIAGLHHGLHLVTNVGAALAAIHSGRKNKPVLSEISVDHHHWIYHSTGEDKITGQLCLTNEIVGYHELGDALGFGSLSNAAAPGNGCSDFFVSLDNCSGFLPLNQSADPDFRITSDPVKTGFPVCEALSFGCHPTGSLKSSSPGQVTFSQLNNVIRYFEEDTLSKSSVILLVIANPDKNRPSLTLAVTNNEYLQELVRDNGMIHFRQLLTENTGKKDFTGITFLLAELDLSTRTNSIHDISRHLTFENILAVEPVNQETILENPFIWLFQAGNFVDARTKRLTIDIKPGFIFESHKAFLTRLLYTDSSKLVIDPLHGGFSAQTFQVASFDHEGRKMRPTVLKIANRNLITRESERCKKYALPYIFNNSAVVLGAEFYGETGALRYNFVGIGGESSQLKWLTHYYLHSDISFLEPLFDKIFLQILKPWYGQPVKKTIFPFKDHDPTFTFFPYIYQTVHDLFSVSSDEKYLNIPEKKQPILNPYWFLKHEFSRRRERGMEYFTGICHGDLNMQNILLDENMNVYLIDFSETQPRSIISDFARLEAIFLVDNAPLENDSDLADYLRFIHGFYQAGTLKDIPEINYTGKHSGKVMKNAALTLKMRKYAYDSARENPDPIPYYLALLEWVLPIVCYSSMPVAHKRLAMIVSSILCEKVMDFT